MLRNLRLILVGACGAIACLAPSVGTADEPDFWLQHQKSLSAAQVSLTLKLLETISAEKPGESVIVSPISTAGALGLLYRGASKPMQRAIHGVVGFDPSGSSSKRSADLEILHEWPFTVVSDEEPGPVSYGEAIWFDDGSPPYPRMAKTLAEHTDNDPMVIDLAAPEAVTTINDWVAKVTRGLIPDIIDELPGNASMVAANALYFKEIWQQQFDPALTITRPFHKADGSDVDVSMMRLAGNLAYRRDDRFQAIDLSYVGGRYRMTVVGTNGSGDAGAPLAETLADAASWLVGEGFEAGTVQLSLPSFRASAAIELLPVLSGIGLGDLLDDPRSFSGFGPQAQRLSRVRQRCEIIVDEAGTEAAAATVAIATRSAGSRVVKLAFDQPFVFALRDTLTGAILMAGYVADPAKAGSD